MNQIRVVWLLCRNHGEKNAAFGCNTEMLASAIAGILPDEQSAKRFASLCNELEDHCSCGQTQNVSLIEFASLTLGGQ